MKKRDYLLEDFHSNGIYLKGEKNKEREYKFDYSFKILNISLILVLTYILILIPLSRLIFDNIIISCVIGFSSILGFIPYLVYIYKNDINMD